MNREREDRFVPAKNRRRAIPVVHVRIDHHRALDRAIVLQSPDRHGHIVNHAETFAMIGTRMMESAADIRRPAISQRALSRENRSSRGQPARVHQFLRVRYFESRNFGLAQRSRLQLPNVFLSMDAQNIFIRCRLRRQKIVCIGDSLR